MERRTFLGCCLGALVGAPAAATLLDPALHEGAAATWKDAGGLGGIAEGVPVRFTYEIAAGWEKRKETAYLVRRGEGATAFSARCTHAGCLLRAEGGEFRCPCHQGAFDLEGAPLRGPVRTPLVRLPVRVENGRLLVRTG